MDFDQLKKIVISGNNSIQELIRFVSPIMDDLCRQDFEVISNVVQITTENITENSEFFTRLVDAEKNNPCDSFRDSLRYGIIEEILNQSRLTDGVTDTAEHFVHGLSTEVP
jgi:hypothetical protein